jgi:hypothetical protein
LSITRSFYATMDSTSGLRISRKGAVGNRVCGEMFLPLFCLGTKNGPAKGARTALDPDRRL